MATLKDDDSSWKASGIKRRDFRHTHGGPNTPKGRGKRKNTKQWCKGKVGTPHILQHQQHPKYPKWSHVDLCVECGKEVKYYWLPLPIQRQFQRCDGCT
jgi:hypothetical protein